MAGISGTLGMLTGTIGLFLGFFSLRRHDDLLRGARVAGIGAILVTAVTK